MHKLLRTCTLAVLAVSVVAGATPTPTPAAAAVEDPVRCTSTGNDQAFIREANGDYGKVTHPDAVEITAYAVSNSGKIVGGYRDSTGKVRGYLLNKIGAELQPIEYPGADFTVALRINDRDQIVGAYSNDPAICRGFVLDGTTFKSIDLTDAVDVLPSGINDQGQIVGVYTDSDNIGRGFLLTGTTLTKIEPPDAATTGSWAIDINDSGVIVGGYDQDGPNPRGFRRDADGTYSEVKISPTTLTIPTGINNNLQIVGQSREAGQTRVRGFLLNGTQVTWIVPDFAAGNTAAFGINDQGRIAGIYLA